MKKKMDKRHAVTGLLALGVAAGIVLTGCDRAGINGQEESQKTAEIAGKKTEVKTLAAAEYPEEPVFKDSDTQWDWSREKRMKLPETFAEAYQDFAIDTTAELFKDTKENMVYSPLSLYYALSFASEGAGGETQEEMLKLLGYGDAESLMEDCKASFESLYYMPNEENNKPNEWGEYSAESRGTLAIANSLWADDTFSVKEEFADLGAEYFYADLYQGDLQSEGIAEAKAKWISERTNGLITPAAEPADERALLSIVNTIYFYDEWINRFDKEKTEADTFTCSDGTEVTCDFMNMKMMSSGFRKGENYTESSLSMKNGTMTFYLPDEGVDVRELVQDAKMLETILDGTGEYDYGEVVWQVPKFSYGSRVSLVDTLKALGMEQAFDMDADFSGISDESTLFISSVNHEAHLGIHEEGVEGAAFTEIMYAGAGMPKNSAEMILDRPFLYTVKKNGNIVFVGICENPAEE